MISCDTNLFIYALNPASPYHEKATHFFRSVEDSDEFVVCELVLLELYRLLRNPVVLREPLASGLAFSKIQEYRMNPSWMLVDYPGGLMQKIWDWVEKHDSAPSRLYDARLALTLRHHGVTEFATRNLKDFQGFGFKRVFDPVV